MKALLVGAITSLTAGSAFACSVLSHEALVDARWDQQLKPALLARYPNATPEELKRAHGYAYGGSIIQDLGYYPHGSKRFSDMAHYVRTGDFVVAMLNGAQDRNQYAFALGALSHYASDADVHRFATNPGEAILYPKLRKKFGPVVTYAEDPSAHLKTEFGFDVLEVARGNYAPDSYHDFIGFYVSEDLLVRAFRATYGLNLSELFPNFERAIESYRRAVSKTIPMATRIAWAQRQNEIQATQPGITEKKFVYVMSRSSYERDWGRKYQRPTMLDHFLAFTLKIIPPVGPLRALHFKMPTPEVEQLFMKSFERATGEYQRQLETEKEGRLKLPDINYDLGEPARPGLYSLEDKAYFQWVDALANNSFEGVSEDTRMHLLSYYREPGSLPQHLKAEQWSRLQAELRALGRLGRSARN